MLALARKLVNGNEDDTADTVEAAFAQARTAESESEAYLVDEGWQAADVEVQGIKHGPLSVELFYGTPSPGNDNARVLYGKNRFSVTRQLHYSRDNSQLALDLCLFINGLPIATFRVEEQPHQADCRGRCRTVQA